MSGRSSLLNSTPARAAAGVLAAVALAATAPAQGGPWRVTVQGRQGNPGETPVVAEVKADIPAGDYALRPEGQGTACPAQVFQDGGKTYLATVLKGLPDGSTLTFTLDKAGPNGAGVALKKDGPNVEILVGGKPLTTYHTDLATKPFYYPLVGPTGASYTRAYPMQKDVPGEDRDHPHQRAFWFTHGAVNGLDFWASDPQNRPKANDGTIKETSRQLVTSGAAVAVLRTTDDWLGPGGKKVCDDERVVRAFATTGVRVVDFDITLKATTGLVRFGDTKEGMFGLRVASSMDVNKKQGGKITNAEGIHDDAAWGKASPWVDYTGPVEGKTVGVAILNHPDSFRFPTTWHVRTYGLFAANPFGWHDFGRPESGEFVVPSGSSIRFRYRVLLHEGDTPSAHLPEAFQAYATPPTVEVRGE
jgi:hypothetical protein